jgi:Zn-dependent protease with chaperone function
MLYIAINVLFNAIILGITFAFGGVLLGWHIPDYWYWIAGYVVSGGLTLIGYTQFATDIVGLFMSGRKMIGRERDKLAPLFREVIEKVNKEYGTNYRYEDLNIKVSDDKLVNAFALGYRNIRISRACFEAFTDGQLKAVLAHEMGHLFYRDSVRSIALIFSSFATRIVMWLYAVIVVVQAFFAKIAAGFGEHGAMAAIVSFVPLLIFLPVVVFNWLGGKVFMLLNMVLSRKAEYRADMFAASLGFKADMIQALEVIDGVTVIDNSFLAKMMATHPAPMQRIGALEDGELQLKRLGGLAIAKPFADNTTITVAANSEIIRLASVLGVVGVVWCGFTAYDYYTHPKAVKQVNSVSSVVGEKAQNAKSHFKGLKSIN